jgi:hypothetical protein
VSEPRIVGIANPVFDGNAGDGTLRFLAPRLGTYQAVVRDDVPRARMRRFNYRGILGFSMGGSGSGRIGLGNNELFDFVAPLGGPTDWQYLLEYIRRYHLGGFCTAEERAADTTGRCDEVNRERPAARGELFEHTQTFENWWYEDMYDGQGGTFNREDYIAIFRDLSAMFSNPNTDTDAFDVVDARTPSIAPPGTPESIRTMPDPARCADGAEQVVIRGHCPDASPTDTCAADADPTTGWYDDEYNPDGRWDVISFCDGGEIDVGNWDPSARQFTPIEVAYAVDVDHDGVRDPGEPVIRNGRETFDDFGCDRTPSAMEAGFDALTNPDPAGDDYDFQYNPNGTEGNYDYDAEGVCAAGASERFDDYGIDGVNGTPQIAAGGGGGYDVGEGDGAFNRTRGAERMIASSPRGAATAIATASGTRASRTPSSRTSTSSPTVACATSSTGSCRATTRWAASPAAACPFATTTASARCTSMARASSTTRTCRGARSATTRWCATATSTRPSPIASPAMAATSERRTSCWTG